MKNKSRSKLFVCFSLIFSACIAFAFITGAVWSRQTVSADADPIGKTKYMISTNGDYLLLATAFKLDQLEEGQGYAFGYDIAIDGVAQDDTYYSSIYYVGLTLKAGAGTVSYAPEDIFGEDYSVENGYALIVEEIPYVVGSVYDYRMYIEQAGEDKVYGTAYTGHQRFEVTFDWNDGSYAESKLVKSGATVNEPVAPERDGYNLVWKNGDDQFDFDAPIIENTVLTACWKERPTDIVLADAHSYMIDKYNDVAFDVELNDYAAGELEIAYMGTEYTEDDDFYYDAENEKLVLKASMLNEIYRFGTSQYTLSLNGTEFTVEYENPENRILNGGFETGTLYGWNVYQIWKNEPTMLAWMDDRVVNGTYFDDKYSYNRDGNYNLGIYGGSISKDSGQERMGHLRSPNFTLGGSGWVSFKLGGGKRAQFAYVSVRRTDDNVEVARFGNRHFDDASKVPANNSKDGSKKNAEAYLFTYYFDLSDYLGEDLYFVISDTSSNHWCVLSADSFYTYYEKAPATTEDTLAVNILPTVKYSENTAEYTIPNDLKGSNSFTSDRLSKYWTIDGSGWDLDGETMKSNKINGDSGYGILRSPAFTVNGEKKYICFEWKGGLEFDKTIYVSVKELGTNIEVLRFVRRSGFTNDQRHSDYNNHCLDLTSLSNDKYYYVEFCDSETSSWGISYVKQARMLPESDSKVNSGDMANMITGIVTDYTYVLPY